MNPQVIKSVCDVQFADLLEKVNENAKVLDFAKIKQTFHNYHVYVLATNRGSFGKTTGAKRLGLAEWKRNQKPSLFLKNTVAQIEDEYTKFASPDVVKVIPEYNELEHKLLRFDLYNQKLWDLQAINAYDAMKGTRVAYNNIFYDEINEKSEFVRKGNIVAFLNSILASTDNQVANAGKTRDDYLWLMCNYKDMNNLILLSLGITNLTEQVATYDLVYDDIKVPFCVVIRNSYSQKEQDVIIKRNLRDDWRLAFGLASGDYRHTYFNEAYNQEDETWNVVPSHYLKRYLPSPQMKIKADNNEFVYFTKIANKIVRTLHLWIATEKPLDEENCYNEFVLKVQKIRENQYYNRFLKDELANKIAANKMFFDSIKTRTLFLNMLK